MYRVKSVILGSQKSIKCYVYCEICDSGGATITQTLCIFPDISCTGEVGFEENIAGAVDGLILVCRAARPSSCSAQALCQSVFRPPESQISLYT